MDMLKLGVGLLMFSVIAVGVAIPAMWESITTVNVGTPASVDWLDATEGCRMPITLTNGGLAPLNQQDIYYIPYQTGGRTNFGDIRFYYDDGTPIPYWIEEYTSSSHAHVWLYYDNLAPGDTTIYMYYCNASKSTTGNGTAVFPFFDDFNDDAIDPALWTIYAPYYTDCDEDGGVLYSPSADTSQCFVTASYDTQVHYEIITAGHVSDDDWMWGEYYIRYDGVNSPMASRSYSYEMYNTPPFESNDLWNNTIASFHQDNLDTGPISTHGQHRYRIRAYGDNITVWDGLHTPTQILTGIDATNYNRSSAIWLNGCGGMP